MILDGDGRVANGAVIGPYNEGDPLVVTCATETGEPPHYGEIPVEGGRGSE